MWKSIVVAYSEETLNPEDGIWDVECKQLELDTLTFDSHSIGSVQFSDEL